MSYQSQALATPNLLALWMLTDAAGSTTAIDVGPNNLPLTYSAAKVNGVNNILGASLGMLSGAGGVMASRAVTAGSTLAPTGPMTIAAWITPAAFLTGGASQVAGRATHFRIACNAFGSLGVSGVVGGVSQDLRSPQGWTATGDTFFLVGVFTGSTFKVYINGALVQEAAKSGTLAATADPFSVSSASTPMDGTISGVGVWGRALNTGEIWELWLAGTKIAVAVQGVMIDNLYDTQPVIAAAAAGARCGVCHGLRRANEPVIVDGVDLAHPGCYGAAGLAKTPIVPTSSDAFTAYEGAIRRALHLQMLVHSERVAGLARPAYFDGDRLQPATNAALTTSHFDMYGPWALTGALIARHAHLPAQHWLIDLAASQVEQMWTLQNSLGNLVEATTAGGGDFVMAQIGEAILYLAPYLSDSTLSRWKTNFAKLGDYYLTQPPGQPEAQYYVNGNREAFELLGYWMLWLATEDTKWRDQYETQYAFLTAPPNNSGAPDSTGNATYGLVTVVTPTQVDGSDGKAYLIERSGSRLGTITGPGGGVLSGYDPNYVLFCNTALARLWLYNRDPRILRIMNMQHNLIADRANQTSATVGDVPAWTLDGRGGSRQNNLTTFGTSTIGVLREQAGQTRFTATQLAGAFNECIRFFTNDAITASGGLNREVSTNMAMWLMALPTWPGLPT